MRRRVAERRVVVALVRRAAMRIGVAGEVQARERGSRDKGRGAGENLLPRELRHV
jgi:hypothetical protein